MQQKASPSAAAPVQLCLLQAPMEERSRQPINLPDGCWLLVLSKLDFLSCIRCETVSRQLRSLLKEADAWPCFDLTLEQLVGTDNDDWRHNLRTPAAK